MAVFTGQYGSPAGRANGIAAITSIQDNALLGNPIDVGSFVDLGTIGTDGLHSMIICKNKQNVRPFRRKSSSQGTGHYSPLIDGRNSHR